MCVFLEFPCALLQWLSFCQRYHKPLFALFFLFSTSLICYANVCEIRYFNAKCWRGIQHQMKRRSNFSFLKDFEANIWKRNGKVRYFSPMVLTTAKASDLYSIYKFQKRLHQDRDNLERLLGLIYDLLRENLLACLS